MTRNYEQFKTIPGNRTIDNAHVKNLIQSISKENNLEYNPILVNAELEVIDGQHRLIAAKELELPIFYVIKHDADINTVIRHNTNNKNWNTNDYFNLFIEKGISDYIILHDFCKLYDLSVTIAILIMAKGNRPKGFMKEFKEGRYKITNLKAAEEFAKRLQDIQPYVERGVCINRDFIIALMRGYKIMTHENFIKQLRKMKSKLSPQPTIKDYLRKIEDIYNYELHYKVNFFS